MTKSTTFKYQQTDEEGEEGGGEGGGRGDQMVGDKKRSKGYEFKEIKWWEIKEIKGVGRGKFDK
jgi:hypothetical protein